MSAPNSFASARRSLLKSLTMMGEIERRANAATADSPMAPGADDDGHILVRDPRRPHVPLPHGECVGQRYRVIIDAVRNDARHSLADEQQLTETAWRVGVLTDDVPTVRREQKWDAGDPAADRELVGVDAFTVADDFTDELVAHHDVGLGVVSGKQRVVAAGVGVVHEVQVRCTDGAGQCAQKKLPRNGFRVRRFPDGHPSVVQYGCSHMFSPGFLGRLKVTLQ